MRQLAALVLAGSVLAGCSAAGSAKPLIPDKVIQLTANSALSLSNIATGLAVIGAIYLVYDPLAPNWEINESRLNEDTYRFDMKMKRYHTGGGGESFQIMKRRASQLQYERGYSGYQILEYTEGIDSETLGARRVAGGVIRMLGQPQTVVQAQRMPSPQLPVPENADSFGLN